MVFHITLEKMMNFNIKQIRDLIKLKIDKNFTPK